MRSAAGRLTVTFAFDDPCCGGVLIAKLLPACGRARTCAVARRPAQVLSEWLRARTLTLTMRKPRRPRQAAPRPRRAAARRARECRQSARARANRAARAADHR